jgi:hypothetical protein
MSWITVDTKLPDHPKMAALPNDTARWGWIVTLLEAKEQRTPGTFASEKHYRHVMPRHGRFLGDYIKAGLIDKGDDGTLHVHDWKRHQWAVSKAQQRGTPEGQDEDINETFVGQKEDASRAVPVRVPVSVESTEGVQGEPDAAVSLHRRTGEVPGPKIMRWLTELADAHSEARLAAMIEDTPYSGDLPNYIRSVRDRLRLEDIAADRAEKRDEERRTAEKRRPVVVPPPADDISDDEAKRLAAEYMGRSA